MLHALRGPLRRGHIMHYIRSFVRLSLRLSHPAL